ncbi:MAG TPA: amidase [Acidimicrobiales bacterium]
MSDTSGPAPLAQPGQPGEPDRTLATRSIDDALGTLRALVVDDPPAPPPLVVSSLHLAPYRPAAAPALTRHRSAGAPRPVPARVDGEGLADVAIAIAKGSTSCRQLLEDALEAMARTTDLGAMVHVDPDDIRRQADRLDAEAAGGRVRGPLHGIPLTVKDVIHVQGMPTRAGSVTYEALDPPEGTAVARLRAAGALVVGKVATHEFALGVTTPQCRNPHDPSAIAGGSSGGSAIAVATGVGLASLGTDTRASLRVPSALCGVVGFKPTFGRVPVDGIVPLSWTMDHLGPIARTVADAAAVLEVLAGPAGLGPAAGQDLAGLVVGAPVAILEEADPIVAAAVENVLGTLSRLGCRVLDAPCPSAADLDVANALGLLISRSEAATFHRAQGTDIERCLPEVRDQLRAALDIPAVDYLDAQRQRAALGARVRAGLAGIDLLVTPTTPVTAPRRDDYEGFLLVLSRNAIIWSLLGNPALSLPCGSSAAGLPIGVQLTAGPGRERLLAQVGTALESALSTGTSQP